MPDLADKGRPSSAPLSVEDADRLADSFTAFWDDAPVPPEVAPVAAPAPAAAPAPVTASTPPAAPTPVAPIAADAQHPGSVTAPMPVVVQPIPQPKPLGKQTLLGIAPISIDKPARSEPSHSAPIQSSPEVPGYAIAYTPKDPPSTPAVVIAPEAQSAPDHLPPENKRVYSQTVPSRVRSAPTASVAPLAPPTPAPVVDDFNPYAAKKGKGKLIGLVMAGALVLIVSVVGVRALGGGDHASFGPTAPANLATTDVVRAATVGAATPTPAPTEPAEIATPASSTPAEPERALVGLSPASERAAAKAKAKAKVKAEPAAAAARPVTRAPSSEPSPAPTKPASKGVIVRDAPF